MAPTSDQIELVLRLIPNEAQLSEEGGGYGWDSAYVSELMTENAYTPTQAVRFFWLQRVNESAEYLDVGKPLTQIHKQARAMLDYWDNIIAKWGVDATEPEAPQDNRTSISFGSIERPESYRFLANAREYE